MIDVRQSDFWATYLKKLGWAVVKNQNYIYTRKLPIAGSLIKIPRIKPPIPFKEIDQVAKETRALFVKLEPNTGLDDKSLASKLKFQGFNEDGWSLQPTKTISIELTLSEETLLSNMEKDTRYSIRKAQRDGVKIGESRDFDAFAALHKETAKRQGFWTSEKDSKALWESLSNENRALLFAKKDDEILAGAFLIFFDGVCYYYEAASSTSRRDLMAPYLTIWEGIKLAKKKGCKKFDFEGIFDERIKATKSWKGFTHFKRGFGGKEETYLGSFVKFYNPIAKFIFFFNKFF
ncbi:MAG: peptidoglycan bridge formation glycyltransferase FemA/FemB family protein [Candidatus Woykebacteria bacterium]